MYGKGWLLAIEFESLEGLGFEIGIVRGIQNL